MPKTHGRRTGRDTLAYAGLVLLFLISITFRIRENFDLFKVTFYPTEVVREPFGLAEPRYEMVSLQAEAQAAGFKRGDTLTAVAGRPYRGAVDYHAPLRNSRPGDRLTVQVRASDGTTRESQIVLQPLRGGPLTRREIIQQVVMNILMPLLCVALGFWVAAVRIRDPLAWILLLLMLSFAEQSGASSMTFFGRDDFYQSIGAGYEQLAANLWGVMMMLFGIYFPDRLDIDRRWPWAKWLMLVPLLFRACQNGLAHSLAGRHADAAIWIENAVSLGSAFMILQMSSVSIFFAGTGYKHGTATNPDAKRRLFLLHAGATVTLTPIFILVLINLFRGTSWVDFPVWISFPTFMLLALFPVTMAYVIVVHRALDVSVVIRQSVQYLLATNTVRILQMTLMFAVIFSAAYLASDSSSTISHPQRIQIVGLGFFAVIVIQRLAEKLRGWVDRRFFREAYNADQILSDLAEKVRTIVEAPVLLETVAKRIAESLHVKRVALLLPQGSDFQPAYALGYAEPPWATIPENGVTTEQLKRDKHAQIYRDDAASWIHRPDISEEERRSLHCLDSQLLLALSLNQKLLGILSLGPKQSEAPFSKGDIRLLNSVAMQTGLSLENSRLTAAVATEVAHRERMNREIEIAREVQERLFPQESPEFPGIDYVGTCRPALGVGGDYYDFLRISETELGIAIGDVSGKGIPAALLMASLRASLRGQTIRRETDLAFLMGNVNKLVYESSTSNRYATFFYAQYDSASRKMTYVNGGHNPPLIFRKGSDVIRLETGGPVVGLLPEFPYEQAVVELCPGDLLVAFTDGISEAMNAEDLEWGEDRLIACAWECIDLPPEETMKKIIAAADQFVAGAKQHDDMTIIVAAIR